MCALDQSKLYELYHFEIIRRIKNSILYYSLLFPIPHIYDFTRLIKSMLKPAIGWQPKMTKNNAISLILSSRFMGSVIQKIGRCSTKSTDQPFLATFSLKRCLNMLLKCLPEWNVDRNGTFLGKFLDDLTAKLVLFNVSFNFFCPKRSYI